MALVDEGAVLGVDVGMSPTRRSSAVCLFDWDGERVGWTIRRFRALDEERRAAIGETIGIRTLQAAAFDGPFREALDVIGAYRAAERVLTRPAFRNRIGKPGQASAPVGKSLNEHTNYCVREALPRVVAAGHPGAVHVRAVVEAFPSSFMGLLLEAPEDLGAVRGNRSDLFYRELVRTGILARLIAHLLPGRTLGGDLDAVTNHDDRSALICAVTALAVVVGDFVSVGDADGRIVLPPQGLMAGWGQAALADPEIADAVLVVGPNG